MAAFCLFSSTSGLMMSRKLRNKKIRKFGVPFFLNPCSEGVPILGGSYSGDPLITFKISVSSMFSITFKPCHSSAIEPIQTIFSNVVDTSQGCISANFGQNLHTGNRDIRSQTFNVNLVLTQSRLSQLHTLSNWIVKSRHRFMEFII